MTRAVLAAGAASATIVLAALAALAGSTGGRRRPLTEIDGAAGRPAGSPRRGRLSSSVVAFGAAALGALVGLAVTGVPGAIGLGGAAAVAPIVRARRRTARLATMTEAQLLDAVGAVASAIRSGRSLLQALEIAAEETGEPLGPTLAVVSDRVALGEPLDRALEDWAAAVGGPDARLVAGVLRLHRRTGGALARSLDDLARTLRGRREAGRELRSLTAQARLSAGILGLLPLGFFLFLSVVARRDIESAYRTPVGASAIVVGLTLQGLAFAWIRRLLRPELE